MRPPLIPLLLLIVAAPLRAEEEWDEAKNGIKPERAYLVATEHFLKHEVGQPLLDTHNNIPYSDAHAERIVQAKTAIREVEAGCVAPCDDPAQIVLYSGKIDFIAERLRMKPDQVQLAKQRYIPEGKPRLRPADLKYKPDANLTGVIDQRVIEAQLKSQELTPQIRQQLTERSKRMADALGKTLGPGDMIGGDETATAFAGGGGSRMSVAQYASLPGAQSALYKKRESTVPDLPSANQATQPLENAIVRAQRRFPNDPEMQQAVRSILTTADARMQKGQKPDGAMFENFYSISSYDTKLNLMASDELKSYRGDYGGASAGMPASVRFAQDTGLDLSNKQLADLDHFFYASGTGAGGPVGYVACVGMSTVWDGLLPTAKYAYQAVVGDGDEEALRYNYQQVRTDISGCNHGAATP